MRDLSLSRPSHRFRLWVQTGRVLKLVKRSILRCNKYRNRDALCVCVVAEKFKQDHSQRPTDLPTDRLVDFSPRDGVWLLYTSRPGPHVPAGLTLETFRHYVLATGHQLSSKIILKWLINYLAIACCFERC